MTSSPQPRARRIVIGYDSPEIRAQVEMAAFAASLLRAALAPCRDPDCPVCRQVQTSNRDQGEQRHDLYQSSTGA